MTKWSKNNDNCLSCQSSSLPHKALGLCNKCYLKRRDSTPSRMAYDRERAIIRKHGINLDAYNYLLSKEVCFYCGKKFGNQNHNKLTIDHIIPNGNNVLSNLVSCCYKCNRLKADNTIDSLVMFLEKITNQKVTFTP